MAPPPRSLHDDSSPNDPNLTPPPGRNNPVVSFRPDEQSLTLMEQARKQGRMKSVLLNRAIHECFPRYLSAP